MSLPPEKRTASQTYDYVLKEKVQARELKITTTTPAREFLVFQGQLFNLDDELRKLSKKARQLGSSAGIVSAASRLRERLDRIWVLFFQNACKLFAESALLRAAQAELNRSKYSGLALPSVRQLPAWDPDYVSEELHAFSRDIAALLECFTQFPEFMDEVPDKTFADDLEHWMDIDLVEHKDDFHTHAVHSFLYESMADIGARLDRLATKSIPIFITIGIPTIATSQGHSMGNMANLSTISTFFSGITASMLTLTSNNPGGSGLAAAVNLFWLISLIFSISAAVNSLLGLAWMQSIFRSPDHRVPFWVRIWIKRSPLVFLILSVACFFVGLIIFVYFSDQAKVTSTVTTAFSAVSCFALAAMSFWFAGEFLTYRHHDGRMWLADVLHDFWRDILRSPFLRRLHPYDIFDRSKRVGRSMLIQGEKSVQVLPYFQTGIGHRYRRHTIYDSAKEPTGVSFWLSVDKESMSVSDRARHRWHEAVRRIIDQRHIYAGVHSRRKLLRGTDYAHLSSILLQAADDNSDMLPTLEAMKITQVFDDDDVHDGLVKFLQFSPGGKFLVTSSWDGQSFIVEMAVKLRERTLAHQENRGYVNQVEWSPDGEMLLMRSNRCVALYRKDTAELLSLRVQDENPIRSIAWLPDSKAYLSIEGNKAVKLDVNGREIERHKIDKFIIRDVAVTKDSNWMLCIGKHEIEDDSKACKHKKEKYEILVYSLTDYQVAKRHRVYHEMCDISLTWDSRYALVSYQEKAPPQLWRLRGDASLALELTYMPRDPVNFATLPAGFGWYHDRLVLRATTAGDIYLWERHTAFMLYCIRSPPHLGHLTAFTWNRATVNACMLATGTHDGKVYLWTIPSAPGTEKVQRAQSGASAVDGAAATTPSLPSPGFSETSEGTLVRSPTWSTYGFGSDRGALESPIDRMGSMSRYCEHDEDAASSISESPSARRRSLSSQASEATIDP